MESGKTTLRHRHFTVWKDEKAVRDLAQMKANVASGAEEVVDARSEARFRGDEPETRAGVAPGHIPGSRNLPYGRMFNADGTWKSPQAIRETFAEAGVDLRKPLVTTCGSGVTAAVLLFAARLAGKSDVALYDGSWTDWGSAADTEKAVGA